MAKRDRFEIPLEVFDGDQVFTHKDDDGTERTFLTSAMARIAAKYGGRCDQIRAARLVLQPVAVEHIKAKMGIERNRVDRLVPPYLEIPAIAIQWPGSTNVTIVDGNHRMVRWAEMGRETYLCYIFEHPFWEEFVAPFVQKIPEYSGIIESEARCRKS